MTRRASDTLRARRLLPDLPSALCALALLAASASLATAAPPEIDLDKLGGTWNIAIVTEDRSHALRPGLRKRLWKDTFTFRKRDARTVVATRKSDDARRNGGSVELILEKTRSEQHLRLSSNVARLREIFPAYAITPVAEIPPATIFKGDDLYFIRFLPGPPGARGDFQRMTFLEFCNGPALTMAASARSELAVAARLKQKAPRFFKTYDDSIAAMFGLFRDDVSQRAIGRPFSQMSREEQEDVVGRLQVCAIFHDDPAVSEPLGIALFRAFSNSHVRGTLKMRSTRFRDPSLALKRHPAIIGSLLAREREARAQLDRTVPKAPRPSTLDEARKLEQDLRAGMDRVAPSFVQERAILAASAIQALEERQRRAREEERERTGPPLSGRDLVLQATQRFFLANCNRIVLALRAAKHGNGQGLLAIASTSAIGPKDGFCVTESAMLIGRFQIDRAEQVRCRGAALQECEWTAYFYCSERLNPKFGLSPGTRDLDIRCAVIRRLPVPMKGRFTVKSKRRWDAISLAW
ncbi:MAG: hypothetical protein AB7E70_15430 [Hyphomicrobiaceae bacterium]